MSTEPDAAAEPAIRWERRQWLALGILSLPSMLLALDISLLYLALPKLSTALGSTATELLWITDIYGFMIAGFMITMGTLGDRIGRRRLLMFSSLGFAAASAVAAFSVNPEMLIAMRAVMGIAGASLIPCSMALISTMFPDPRQRTTAMGVWMSCFLGAMAAGPIIGGIMLDHFWWGSVFLLGIPVLALVLLTGPRLLPEYSNPDAGRLDPPSVVLSLAAILPAVYGFKELAGHGWGVLPAVAMVAGLAFAVVFVRRQRRLEHPLLDLALLRNIRLSATLVILLLTAVLMGGIFLFVALYLQDVQGLSPFQAGLWLIPQSITMIIASNLGPALARRFRTEHIVVDGLLVMAAGFFMAAQTPAHNGVLPLVIGFSLATAGIGTVFTLLMDLIVGSAPPERAASAASMAQTANELGIALGLAVLGSIGTVIYRSQLPTKLPQGLSNDVVASATESLTAAVKTAADVSGPAGADVLAAARSAFTAGLNVNASLGTALLVALTLLAAVALRSAKPSPSKAHEPEPSGAVEPEEGGSWDLSMVDHATGGSFPIRSTILVCIPPEYLETIVKAEKGGDPIEYVVLRVEFHDHGDRTRITPHQGPFTDELCDLTDAGWNVSFEKPDAIFAQSSSSMGTAVLDISMSLDGFITGPNGNHDQPGDKDVYVVGGASIAQQYLSAGVLDEVRLHLAHVLMGGGVRLFDDLNPRVKLVATSILAASGVTHLTFRAARAPLKGASS
jgi:DHA2 family multidrug resistance protein-like MFS transporter